MVHHFKDVSRVNAGLDRKLCGFVGLVALAGSLSALQADRIVTPDAAVVLAGILVLAAVALSITWRSAVLRPSTSSEGLIDHAEPAPLADTPSPPGMGSDTTLKEPASSGDAAELAMVLRELSSGLARFASGDLTTRIAAAFPSEYEELRNGFNDAMERNAVSVALARQGVSPEAVAFIADTRQAAPAVVTRSPQPRRAAKVDLFAGRMTEFIELRDARASMRQ